MGQTPNNFTILNRDYNIQRYNLNKEKLYFSFHSLLSSSVWIFSYPLYFSPLLLALTHAVLPDCTQFSVSLAGISLFFPWGFTSSPPGTSLLQPIFIGRMASLFISSSFPSFLPFTLFISSHNKCKPTYLDFASTNFFSSALPQPNDPCFFLFFHPSNVSHEFNITYSFM